MTRGKEPASRAATREGCAASDATGPSIAGAVLRPFRAALQEVDGVSETQRDKLCDVPPERRIDATQANDILAAIVAATGDELLGVRACGHAGIGDVGLFDFALRSAATMRCWLETARLLMPLASSATDLQYCVIGEQVLVFLENRIRMEAVAEDFMLCRLIRNHVPIWPSGLVRSVEVWFTHRQPRESAPYRELLGEARLWFGAPFCGFSFSTMFLDRPQQTADDKLHALLRRYAELQLPHLTMRTSTAERVRSVLRDRLRWPSIGIEEVAASLQLTPRVLARRLAREGKGFSELLEEARRTIALGTVVATDLPLAELAVAVGYGEASSFTRAFRRWTGESASEYRRRWR